MITDVTSKTGGSMEFQDDAEATLSVGASSGRTKERESTVGAGSGNLTTSEPFDAEENIRAAQEFSRARITGGWGQGPIFKAIPQEPPKTRRIVEESQRTQGVPEDRIWAAGTKVHLSQTVQVETYDKSIGSGMKMDKGQLFLRHGCRQHVGTHQRLKTSRWKSRWTNPPVLQQQKISMAQWRAS